ncbi:hypothetical protein B8W95_14130, partial [Staphylococcus pasteuri]
MAAAAGELERQLQQERARAQAASQEKHLGASPIHTCICSASTRHCSSSSSPVMLLRPRRVRMRGPGNASL